jgi:cytochrome c553
MMPIMRWAGFVLVACSTPIAMAAGDAAAGAAKAAVCFACHGPNGNSVNGQWPTLAGQGAAYIETQLKHFHDKTRIDASGVMPPMAAALSDQDMQDLAAYFSQQTTTGHDADPSYWQAGQKLYRGGDRARSIPACVACHGPVGEYAADKRYTRNDKGESSGGPNADIMHTIAGRLTAQDIRNLASYVQGMR